MFLYFSPSHRSSPPVHPLDGVLFNAVAIYKRRGDARRFHERIRIREQTYSTFLRFPCFYLPHEVAWALEDGPGTSASANTRLSPPLERFICTREIISVTRNTPAAAYCCWETSCLNTDTFRLYVYIWCVLFRRLSGKHFGKCGT